MHPIKKVAVRKSFPRLPTYWVRSRTHSFQKQNHCWKTIATKHSFPTIRFYNTRPLWVFFTCFACSLPNACMCRGRPRKKKRGELAIPCQCHINAIPMLVCMLSPQCTGASQWTVSHRVLLLLTLGLWTMFHIDLSSHSTSPSVSLSLSRPLCLSRYLVLTQGLWTTFPTDLNTLPHCFSLPLSCWHLDTRQCFPQTYSHTLSVSPSFSHSCWHWSSRCCCFL